MFSIKNLLRTGYVIAFLISMSAVLYAQTDFFAQGFSRCHRMAVGDPLRTFGCKAHATALNPCPNIPSWCTINGVDTQFLFRNNEVEKIHDDCVFDAESDCVIRIDGHLSAICLTWDVYQDPNCSVLKCRRDLWVLDCL